MNPRPGSLLPGLPLLDDGPVAELRQGDTFHEAVGTIHSFIENPGDGSASVLATIVHPPGAALTTLLPD